MNGKILFFVVAVVVTKQCQLLMTVLFMKLEIFLNSVFVCIFFNGKVGWYAIKITFCCKKGEN